MNKTLFISHSNALFGAETLLLQTLQTIFNEETKEQIVVVTPFLGKNEPPLFTKAVQQIGIRNIQSMPYKNLGGSFLRSILVLIYTSYAVLAMVSLVKRERIEIIFSNTSVTCAGLLAAALSRKEHIWYVHESPRFELFSDKKLTIIYRMLLRYTKSRMIFESHTQRKEWEAFLGCSIHNAKVVYNPVKMINAPPGGPREHEGGVVYGYLGNLDKRKNVRLLIECFADLRREFPGRLVVAGDGDKRPALEAMIKELQIESAVSLPGLVSDVSAFFSHIDVFVLPSLADCMPLAAMEAMSAKKAVIVTRNCYLPELFVDKTDCFFFDPDNKVELLTAMRHVQDEETRKQLAKNGYEKMRKYDFNGRFAEEMKGLLGVR